MLEALRVILKAKYRKGPQPEPAHSAHCLALLLLLIMATHLPFSSCRPRQRPGSSWGPEPGDVPKQRLFILKKSSVLIFFYGFYFCAISKNCLFNLRS